MSLSAMCYNILVQLSPSDRDEYFEVSGGN